MRAYLQGPLPLAIAHRGGARLWPENTLYAFQQAADLGYKNFETDVHLTRDGMLVACHDATLERTTDGTGRIRDHSLLELKRLDAGYGFTTDGGATFPFRGQGLKIPLLEELLEALPDARFAVEIKPISRSIVAELLRVVDAHSSRDRLIVGSLRLTMLREMRRRSNGTIATSAGPAEVLLFWLAANARCQRFLAPAYDALQIPERLGPLRIVTPTLITAAHGLGLQVRIWTVDDAATMRRLLTWGVDGIMSDRPDVLRSVVNELRERTS